MFAMALGTEVQGLDDAVYFPIAFADVLHDVSGRCFENKGEERDGVRRCHGSVMSTAHVRFPCSRSKSMHSANKAMTNFMWKLGFAFGLITIKCFPVWNRSGNCDGPTGLAVLEVANEFAANFSMAFSRKDVESESRHRVAAQPQANRQRVEGAHEIKKRVE